MKNARRFEVVSFVFPLFPLPVVAVGDVRSCVVSSPMGSFGGNAGAEHPDSRRLCSKYGIVAMRGERAHGFLLDARSCSKVGSMKLAVDSSQQAVVCVEFKHNTSSMSSWRLRLREGR